MKSTPMFIVVYDDGDCINAPYMALPDGSLQYASGDDVIALFTSRRDARRAVRISTAKAKYDKARGEPANDDFLGLSLASVKIRKAAQVAKEASR